MDDNVFWLDCDSCHKWFHGACVGILSEQVPDAWFCDNCLIRRKIHDRKANIQKNSSIDMSVDVERDDLADSVPADGEVEVMWWVFSLPM